MRTRQQEKDIRDARGKAREMANRLASGGLLSDPDKWALLAIDGALELALGMFAEHDRQAKARRDRIQWVYATERTMVAMYKGKTYRYSGAERKVDILGGYGWTWFADASSIESARRKIRKAAKVK
jgi:hypothetical protein